MAEKTLVQQYFEADVERYEKRVKMIREKPDPKLAKSNALLYQALAEKRKEELAAYVRGQPVAFECTAPTAVLESMGFQTINIEGFGIRQAGPPAKRYEEIAMKAGYRPDSMCDMTTVGLGMALSGDLGVPAAMVATNASCESISHMAIALGHYLKHKYNVPYFHLDHYVEETVNPMDYMKKQLEEMIDYLEGKVPGVKFDEEELLRQQMNARWAHDVLADLRKYAQVVPCPLAALETFRIPNAGLVDLPIGREYFEAYRQEVKERVERGWTPVGEEKARVLWCVTGPFFANCFTPLEEKGITVPAVVRGNQESRWEDPDGGNVDWLYRGRKLSPLEQVAEGYCYSSWTAPAEKWISNVIYSARRCKADGVVYFVQVSCFTTQSSAELVRQRVEKELGIPVLVVQGYQMFEDKFNLKEVTERISEFADIVLASKGR